MKKNRSNIKQRISSIFLFNLLLLMMSSLIISPVAATAAPTGKGVLPQKYKSANNVVTAKSNEQMLIPSTVFSNPAAIAVPDNNGPSAQSNITVSGTSGPISSLTVTITGFSAPSPALADGIDMLLVGPGGQK